MRGERRTVTALFADLQGSTAAAERLDPEEWADIANGAFERLIAPVYRYEGMLAQLQGDAVLAFFGAPVAHEDDPVRAVHAGLEMIEALSGYSEQIRRTTGVPLAVRIGINTGLVVVGEVGSDLRVEYTALGDAVNVAARMEQTAEPGTVRITAHTAALLGETFVVTDIGPVEVKGKAQPVHALRVEGVATSASGDRLAPSPIVGREREQRELGAMLERLLAGVGGIATVVGDAGIGKSRLLAALREDADRSFGVAHNNEESGELAWLEGHGRSFDVAVPYGPFLELARRWLQLDRLPREDVYDRIANAVASAHGQADPDTAAYLAHAVGAPLPTEQAKLIAAIETPALHDKTTNAIVSYLEAEARRRPLAIVLDDLHWADALSLALAERLIESAERVPIGLVVAMRPVRDEASWRLAEVAARDAAHRHTAVHLDALDNAATDALLELLVGDAGITAEDRDRIRERAAGNPLFIEEIARSIGDQGTADVPASLSALLTARLDRLDEAARRVAQVAAVVGREFGPDAVAALADGTDVDAGVTTLVRAGILVEQRRLPRPVYAFRHALVQETAYSTVLLKDRRRLHGQLARHLETTEPPPAYEIARHHLASDTPTAAYPWLVEAGERAARTMAVSEAIRLFSTALDNVPPETEPDEVARAHEGLGQSYSLVPDLDHASAAYQSLADYARTCELPSLEVRALNRLGLNAAILAGDYDTANRYLADARSLAQAAGDELGLAEYHMNACYVAVAQGQLDHAVSHDEATARLGRENDADEIWAIGLVRRAENLIASAEFDRAAEALTEAHEAANSAGAEELLAVLRFNGDALLHERAGDLAEGLAVVLEASRTLERYGSFYEAFAHHRAGRLALWLGDLESALALLAKAVQVAEHKGQEFVVGAAAASLALATAVSGDAEVSPRHRTRALQGLAATIGDFLGATARVDLGFTAIRLGRWDDAAADFAEGLETSSSTRFWERPRLLAGAARVALVRQGPVRARELLDEAADYARTRGMRMLEPVLGEVDGHIHLSRGDLDAAERSLAAAQDAAAGMGMRLSVSDIAGVRAEVAAAAGRHVEAEEHRRRRDGLLEQWRSASAEVELGSPTVQRA